MMLLIFKILVIIDLTVIGMYLGIKLGNVVTKLEDRFKKGDE